MAKSGATRRIQPHSIHRLPLLLVSPLDVSPLTHKLARSPLQQSAWFGQLLGLGRFLTFPSELFVRVVDMENVMNQQKLEGYTSAVRAVSWDLSGNILVRTISACLGSLR